MSKGLHIIASILVAILIITITMVSISHMRYKKLIKQYEHLSEPQITTKPSQKMLIAKVKGIPEKSSKLAMSVLFKTFFQLKRQTKEITLQPPRARWPKSADTPIEEWIGIYGLPITDQVTSLPKTKENSPIKVELATWEYGEVAEILHTGPYDQEKPTIEKLHNFITTQGYQISGMHEEEYIKGPGMFGKGQPKKYKTIIRYPVKKIPLSIQE